MPEEVKGTILNVLNTITHMLICTVAVIACIFGNYISASYHFQQHIILCNVGFTILMTEAILSYNSNNVWSLTLNYNEKKICHVVMQIAGAAIAMAGCIIRIQGVNEHFRTAHGIFGWLAFLLTFISFLGGILNLVMKEHGRLIKIIHSIVGGVTVIFALIGLCFGLDKTIFRVWASDAGANTLITFVAVIMISVLVSFVPTLVKRLKS